MESTLRTETIEKNSLLRRSDVHNSRFAFRLTWKGRFRTLRGTNFSTNT